MIREATVFLSGCYLSLRGDWTNGIQQSGSWIYSSSFQVKDPTAQFERTQSKVSSLSRDHTVDQLDFKFHCKLKAGNLIYPLPGQRINGFVVRAMGSDQEIVRLPAEWRGDQLFAVFVPSEVGSVCSECGQLAGKYLHRACACKTFYFCSKRCMNATDHECKPRHDIHCFCGSPQKTRGPFFKTCNCLCRRFLRFLCSVESCSRRTYFCSEACYSKFHESTFSQCHPYDCTCGCHVRRSSIPESGVTFACFGYDAQVLRYEDSFEDVEASQQVWLQLCR